MEQVADSDRYRGSRAWLNKEVRGEVRRAAAADVSEIFERGGEPADLGRPDEAMMMLATIKAANLGEREEQVLALILPARGTRRSRRNSG